MEEPTIRMLSDNVLVEPLERPEQTESGLWIPDSAAELPAIGRIVAIGPGLRKRRSADRHPVDVRVGALVFFDRHALGGDSYWGDYRLLKLKHLILSLEE